MKQILFFNLIIIMIIFVVPQPCRAKNIFPNEKVGNLLLIAIDNHKESYVMENAAGEQEEGTIGDLLGSDGAEVVAVGTHSISTLTTINYKQENGTTEEKKSQSEIPLVQIIPNEFGGKGIR